MKQFRHLGYLQVDVIYFTIQLLLIHTIYLTRYVYSFKKELQLKIATEKMKINVFRYLYQTSTCEFSMNTNYNIAHTYFNNNIQYSIYKFYEWKQISRTSVTL